LGDFDVVLGGTETRGRPDEYMSAIRNPRAPRWGSQVMLLRVPFNTMSVHWVIEMTNCP